MRIGIAGLQTSHPFTEARILNRQIAGITFVVWDEDPERVAAFRQTVRNSVASTGVTELAAADLDVAMISLRPNDVAAALAVLLDGGVPCAVTKPAAVSHAQLDDLERIVSGRAHRVMSSSVLRFAPGLHGLHDFAPPGILHGHAEVRHALHGWGRADAPWQAAEGGGAIGTLGIHGVEMLATLLGPSFACVGSAISDTATPLRARIDLRWTDGAMGSVLVDGTSAQERYSLSIGTAQERPLAAVLAGDPEGSGDPLGFSGACRALVHLAATGRSNVEWAQTRSVLAAIANAIDRAKIESFPV